MATNNMQIYSAPVLEIKTFACEDIVRTSNENLGGIPSNWKGFLED